MNEIKLLTMCPSPAHGLKFPVSSLPGLPVSVVEFIKKMADHSSLPTRLKPKFYVATFRLHQYVLKLGQEKAAKLCDHFVEVNILSEYTDNQRARFKEAWQRLGILKLSGESHDNH